MQRFLRLLPFNGVAANSLASLDFTRSVMGYAVDRVILEIGGTLTKALMTSIQVLANERPIFDMDGTKWDAQMKYRCIFDEAAHLSIDFGEIRSKTIQGERLGSIDTLMRINQLVIQAQLGAGAGHTLKAWAQVSDIPSATEYPELQLTRPLIDKVLKATQGIPAADTYAMSVPGGGGTGKQGSQIRRVHFHHAGGFMTKLQVKKGGVVIYDTDSAVNVFAQKERQRVPQANVYTFDAIASGNQSERLVTRTDENMEWLATFSAADNVTVVSELYDPLQNL